MLIAIFFIDKFKEELKDEQWSRVRKITYESILDDLDIIFFNLYIHLPIAGISYADPYNPREIELYNETILAELPMKFDEFLRLIPKIIISEHHEFVIEDEEGSGSGLCVSEDDVFRIVTTTFEDIRPVLDGIRYIKIPRIIQSSSDLELIDLMIKFDGSIDLYYYNMRRFLREHDLFRCESTIRSMNDLIHNSMELYSAIKGKIDP